MGMSLLLSQRGAIAAIQLGSLSRTRCNFVKSQISSRIHSGPETTNGGKGTPESSPKKKWKRKIKMDFYYDTISPYSWFAFEILLRYKPIWNLDINFKPIFQGGLVKLSGNSVISSLAGSPNKASYMMTDLERSGKYFKVPLRAPESPMYLFGVAGSLRQQRFLTVVKNHYPDILESVSREFWFRCWAEDMDATKDSSLVVVGDRAGLTSDEIAHILQEITSNETKEALLKSTKEAYEEGAFGLPFMCIHHSNTNVESFFGSDRFEIIADRLRLKWHGPVPNPEDFEPLKMPPDATQQEIFEELERVGAITTDIGDEARKLLETSPRDPPVKN